MDMNHEKQIQQMIKLADDKEKNRLKKSVVIIYPGYLKPYLHC